MALRRALPSKVSASSKGSGMWARPGSGRMVTSSFEAKAKSRSLPALVVAAYRVGIM